MEQWRSTSVALSLWLAVGAVACDGCDDGTVPDGGADAGSDAGSEAGADGGIDGAVPWPELPDCEGAVDGLADLASVPGAGEVRAGRIDQEDELLGGESADGRLGDFKLMNRFVSFVVQDVRAGDFYVPYGGAVVDADLTRPPGSAGHDVVDDLSTALFLRPFRADQVCVLADGSDGGAAIVRAVGGEDRVPLVDGTGLPVRSYGARIVQDFVLEPDRRALRIVTYVAVPNRVRVQLGDFVLLSDDGVDPFALGHGFDRSTLFSEGVREMIGTAGEASHFAMALFPEEPPWQPSSAVTAVLEAFGGDDSTLSMPGSDVAMEPGTRYEYRRYLVLGEDVDQLNRERHRVWGTEVAEVRGEVRSAGGPVAGARVHALRAEDGVWVSMAATDEAGRFAMELPPGDYDLVPTGRGVGSLVETGDLRLPSRPFARGFGTGEAVRVTVPAEGVDDVGPLTLPQPGTVRVGLRDADGTPIPGRVMVLDPEGSEPPSLRATLGERRQFPGAELVAWTIDGSMDIVLPPGDYRIVGVSGLRREVAEASVTVASGETLDVELALPQAYEPTGWMEGDFHVHGGPSIHGEVTKAERVAIVAAEGLDFFTGTDHDWIVDYRPYVTALGLDDAVRAFVSDEISVFPKVHFNAYPLQVVSDAPNGGATPWWDMDGVCEIWNDARSKGAEIVQVNHATSRGSFFQWAEFDWLTGAVGRPDRWCDAFDAMETVNGGLEEELLLAYAGILNTGKMVTPVGVSDSHWRVPLVGQARTFVRTTATTVADFDEAELVRAVRAGATVVSTGPFLDVTVSSGDAVAGPGEVLVVEGGEVTLRVRALAPSWLPIETVSVVASWQCPDADDACSPVHRWGEDTPLVPDGASWLDATVTLTVPGDGWLFVRADGSADLGPAFPGVEPFAHTAAVRLRTR